MHLTRPLVRAFIRDLVEAMVIGMPDYKLNLSAHD